MNNLILGRISMHAQSEFQLDIVFPSGTQKNHERIKIYKQLSEYQKKKEKIKRGLIYSGIKTYNKVIVIQIVFTNTPTDQMGQNRKL